MGGTLSPQEISILPFSFLADPLLGVFFYWYNISTIQKKSLKTKNRGSLFLQSYNIFLAIPLNGWYNIITEMNMILFKEEDKMKKRSKEWISRFEAICKDMGIDINQTLWRGVDLFAIAEKMNCQPYVIMYYLKYERR